MEISTAQKKEALNLLITVLMAVMTESMLKKFADSLLDFAENLVAKTISPIDDAIILPVISKVRSAFTIEDND